MANIKTKAGNPRLRYTGVLSGREHQVLRMRGKKSYGEIAEATNTTLPQVKYFFRMARKQGFVTDNLRNGY